ncbi:CHAD domain-containing protein [Paraburkholderia sp.]|uniref:CHAD domain-containing protein n=1 Tax=Paraburkholderia sp. TaxID=1926495 RepID=UPI00238C06B3|nr:CHAD domain-containing protein [Paraburkholderia sp.]MDE1179239.1 CHAD domain-containing protein [Paraburkholderia sp.]
MKHDTDAPASPDSAEAHFSSYATPLVDDAIAHAASLDADPDAEVLHRLRVTLRRLRSLLWAYRPLLDRGFDDTQRLMFKFLADAAGKTRDWDILIELLDQTLDRGEAAPASLRAARAEALGSSRETLSQAEIKATLRDALKQANVALNTAHQRTPLRKFACKRLALAEKSLDRRMRTASRAKRGDYASFHEVRKAAKKVRYLLEFFEPLLTKKQLKRTKPLKKIHQRFGALNDVVASEALLQSAHGVFPDDASGDAAMAALKKERKRRAKSAAKLL